MHFFREHSQTELVSGSTGLSMKNTLYYSFDVFAATSKLKYMFPVNITSAHYKFEIL